MSISTYASLQTEIGDVLNRADLTTTRSSLSLDSAVKSFIQRAENKLRRDPRARKLQDREFQVTADDATLPTDFQSLDTLYHNGPTYFGAVQVVGADELGDKLGQLAAGGPPQYAAILDARMRFAPVPAATWNLRMTYWLKITPLADGATTNWLLLAHPDIYLYASLLEAAPYIKDHELMGVWKAELNERLEELHLSTWNNQWSGSMRMQFKAIG